MPDISVEDLIRQESEKAGIPPALALAVAEQESGYNPTAIGPKLPSGEQAIGTFQILPSTAKARGFNPADPVENIRGGIGYLRDLLDRHQGDLSAVLREYGGVRSDTTYVPSVLGRLAKLSGAPAPPPGKAPEPGHTATGEALGPLPPTGPVPPPTPPESLASKVYTPVVNAGRGFLHTAVNRSNQFNTWLTNTLLGQEGTRPTPYAPETTTAGKVGAFAEPVAEFAVAAPIARVASVGGPLLEAATQGAAAHVLTKSQGGSETAARVNAGLAGMGPVISKAFEVAAPMIRQRATQQLSRVFASGLENKGPMIDYALKSGETATPEVAKAMQIVRQAASDTLDLPIQASWGKWQTTLAKQVGQKGQQLEEALAGPLGSQEVPKQVVIDALDQLEASTKHLAEIPSGDFREVTFNAPLAREIDVLKNQLNSYGSQITVRNLVDLKRTWDDYVYTLSTAGKVGLTPEALVTSAMKKAMHTGANGIREALESQVPDIARLNAAVTDAIRVQDLTRKLYEANPAMKPTMKNAFTALGFGFGAATMRGVLPGMSGSILGAHLGGATARMVLNAMESPLWQTASPTVKNALAEAMASGQADRVRQLLTPFVSATTSQATAPAR